MEARRNTRHTVLTRVYTLCIYIYIVQKWMARVSIYLAVDTIAPTVLRQIREMSEKQKMTDRSVSLLTKYSEEPPNCALHYLDLRKGSPNPSYFQSWTWSTSQQQRGVWLSTMLGWTYFFCCCFCCGWFLSLLVVAHSVMTNTVLRLHHSLLYPSCVSVPPQQDLSQKCDKAAYEAHVLLWLLLLQDLRSLRFYSGQAWCSLKKSEFSRP